MTADMFFNRTSIRGLLYFAAWTVVGFSFAIQFYVSSSSFGNPVTWMHALAHSLADWYVFGLLSIPAVVLAARFPLEREHRFNRTILHLAVSFGFSFAWVLLRASVARWQIVSATDAAAFGTLAKALFAKTFYFNVLVYWGVGSVTHAIAYYRKFHDREIRELELEKRLAQAKLEALQVQLNPHFLFNTLHAISTLMHKDVEAADRMMARLSDLLRYALDSTQAHEVPLHQELSILEKYLEIEQTRFGERLQFVKSIPVETMNASVPNLVLQPLVENAIRHGIEPLAKPGRIDLTAELIEDQLRLKIRDNGTGPLPDRSRREGIGLANTRARMAHLYGSNQKLEFNHPPGGGFELVITIPFQLASNGGRTGSLDGSVSA